jgi:hypothetical protein
MYDPRWHEIARTWIEDSGLSPETAAKYVGTLAQQLQDCAEQFVDADIPDLEQQADEAARDAHEQQQLDELRGK